MKNTSETLSKNAKLIQKVSWLSLALAVVLSLIKLFAFLKTGALSFFAFLIESLVDIIMSTTTVIATHKSQKPPNELYPFGLGKVEAIFSLFQGVLIILATLFINYKSLDGLIHPSHIEEPLLGIGLSFIITILILLLVLCQTYVLKKVPSLILKTDLLHYKSDLLFSFSILVGFFLYHFHNLYVDPWITLAISVHLLYDAYKIIKESFSILLDASIEDEKLDIIKNIIQEDSNIVGFHELRTRKSGPYFFIQVHLEFSPDLSLQSAHDICEKVEDKIVRTFPQAHVIIHADPYNDTHRNARKSPPILSQGENHEHQY